MKVGILGSGDVGKALARGFVSRGHQVTIASREPEKLASFVHEHPDKLSAGTFEETARAGELLVLVTAFAVAKDAIDLAGLDNFAGKVVIDVTNPLNFEEGKPASLMVSGSDSAGESVQRWLPGARVVKSFNTVGHALFVDPKFPNGPPTMFIAGNDDEAKNTVEQIAESFGWNVLDAGPIEAARYLEAMAMLWITYSMRTRTSQHAFKWLFKS
ncbi:MAG TPA: NADPH-dependent F420 reductase [Candidatus Acidoferrales bacterium]|nr:NADPH-dependent F420 reductase [Candidatus Acidoferrales bacterium]